MELWHAFSTAALFKHLLIAVRKNGGLWTPILVNVGGPIGGTTSDQTCIAYTVDRRYILIVGKPLFLYVEMFYECRNTLFTFLAIFLMIL